MRFVSETRHARCRSWPPSWLFRSPSPPNRPAPTAEVEEVVDTVADPVSVGADSPEAVGAGSRATPAAAEGIAAFPVGAAGFRGIPAGAAGIPDIPAGTAGIPAGTAGG